MKDIEQELKKVSKEMKMLLFIIIILLSVIIFGFTKKPNITSASWYGEPFHGRITASGEIYDMDKLTCAHPYLKFGTSVEVINVKNNKGIIVKVTDRGPYKVGKNGDLVKPLQEHPTRKFDLSKQAFSQIADLDTGIIRIRYRIL